MYHVIPSFADTHTRTDGDDKGITLDGRWIIHERSTSTWTDKMWLIEECKQVNRGGQRMHKHGDWTEGRERGRRGREGGRALALFYIAPFWRERAGRQRKRNEGEAKPTSIE